MTELRETIEGRTGPGRLEGLDALRAIAALMVAVMHMNHVNHDGHAFARAYLAVDLFFVLSGYVMARTYEAKFAGGLTSIRFTALRLRRLWPTMAAGALIGMAAFWGRFDAGESLRIVIMAMLFLPQVNPPHSSFPTNPPAWSILFEIFANIAHVVVLRRLGMRSLTAMALACAATLAIFAPDMNVGEAAGNMWLGVPRVLFSYCAGIIIWRWRGERALLPGWFGILMLPLALLGISGAPPGAQWLDFVFVFVLCPLIVLGGLAPLPFGRLVLRQLGAISFPLYAVHFPLTMLLLFNGFGTLAALPVSLGAALLLWFILDRCGKAFRRRRAIAA